MSGKGTSPDDVADEAMHHFVEYRDGLYCIEVAQMWIIWQSRLQACLGILKIPNGAFSTFPHELL
jgi:hypothetical protein